jgi:MFS family permease
VARAVSLLGDELAAVVLVLRLQEDGAGSWAVSFLLIAGMAPLVLAAPLVGRLADGYDSRLLLVTSSVLQSALCAVLAFTDGLGPCLSMIAAIGVGQAINGTTWQALLPTLAGPERLPRALAATTTATTAAGVLAPALAGGLHELTGPRVPLLLDAGTFLVIGAAALLIRVHRRPERRPAGEKQRGGLAIVRADAVLRPAYVLLAAFITLGAGVNVVEVFLVRETLHASAGWYGAIGGTWALGMVVGSMLAGRLKAPPTFARTLVIASGALSAGLAGYAVAPAVGWILPFAVLGGIGNGLCNVCAGALIAIRTPEAVRGRVGAVTNAIASGSQTGAYLLGGLAAGVLAPRAIFLLAGGLGLAAVATFGPALVRASGGDRGNLVEEAGDELDPAVGPGDEHVEADHHGFPAGRPEPPLEADDAVVGVGDADR